jgi:type IV fimbrial biogenesis protein FimT
MLGEPKPGVRKLHCQLHRYADRYRIHLASRRLWPCVRVHFHGESNWGTGYDGKPMDHMRKQMADKEGRHMLNLRRGFSLVELMVVVALLLILLTLAVPEFSRWIANAQVRSANESLQNGLRLAQAEAQRRYRRVVFFRTTASTCTATTTAVATGTNWVVKTIAADADDPVEVVQCGQMTSSPANLTVAGPTATCFSAAGRLTAVADPDVGGAACTVNAAGLATFNVTGSAPADRRLRVYANLAGNVRSCDREKTQSASTPDGCP